MTLTTMTATTFWACFAVVTYVYVGYPLLVWAAATALGRRREAPGRSTLPMMSVVIAAHNEESVIADRLRNLLDLDYPQDRLEIIIASDGSTDRTSAIVRSFDCARIRLLEFATNRGKVAVLNDAIRAARGEIVLLSDANTMMDRDAARYLAEWFSNPNVGIVCGRLILLDSGTGSNVDSVYWKYETFLKECESDLGALLGANGAIYAIRRSLFPVLSPRIAVDDFVIPLLAKLNSGAHLVYDQRAIAYEETPAEIRDEFSRRSRIGAGGFQSLPLLWPLLNPRMGWTAVAFLSHKLGRWTCPFFLVGMFTCSVLLMNDELYLWALGTQIGLYSVALAGYFSPKVGGVFRLARVPTMFAAMNLALLNGFFLWVSGRQTGVWRRTARL